jgi:hypothetical protein
MSKFEFFNRKVSSIIILYFLGHIALIMEFNQKQDNFEVPKTTNSMKASIISVRMRLTNTLSLLETRELSYKGLIVVNEAIKKEARKCRTYFFQHCPFKNIYIVNIQINCICLSIEKQLLIVMKF